MASKFSVSASVQITDVRNLNQTVREVQRRLQGIDAKVNLKVNDRDLNRTQTALRQTQAELRSTTKEAGLLKDAFYNLGEETAKTIKRYGVFVAGTKIVKEFFFTLQLGVRDAIRFQDEIVKLAQVTGRSVKDMRGLSDEVIRISKSFGVSSRNLLEGSQILAQAGFSIRDTQKLLETLAKVELSPTFSRDVKQNAEGLIAIFQQFGLQIGEVEDAFSSINDVSKRFAVESKDIIAATKIAGGAFAAAGGQIKDFIALFSAVRSTTRESAESIATGFRTIFTRIQRPRTLDFLKTLGIELQDDGLFKGPFKAIRELNAALKGINPQDPRFAQIVEELGGFRQVSKVIPLIQQYEKAVRAREVAESSANSVTLDAIKRQQSLQVEFVKLKEEIFDLIRTIGNDKSFQLITRNILEVTKAVVQLTKAFAPLIGAFSSLAVINLFGKGANTGIERYFKGLRSGFGRPIKTGDDFLELNSGGKVPGVGNTDSVLAKLTPGEFVLRKEAVKRLGVQNIKQLNKAKGFNDGGLVGNAARIFSENRFSSTLLVAGIANELFNNFAKLSDESNELVSGLKSLSGIAIEFGAKFLLFSTLIGKFNKTNSSTPITSLGGGPPPPGYTPPDPNNKPPRRRPPTNRGPVDTTGFAKATGTFTPPTTKSETPIKSLGGATSKRRPSSTTVNASGFNFATAGGILPSTFQEKELNDLADSLETQVSSTSDENVFSAWGGFTQKNASVVKEAAQAAAEVQKESKGVSVAFTRPDPITPTILSSGGLTNIGTRGFGRTYLSPDIGASGPDSQPEINPLDLYKNLGELKGKRVAVTGEVPGYNQADFKKLLIAAGIEVGDVTKNTEFLISGEQTSGNSKGGKLKKATGLGKPVVPVNKFLKKFISTEDQEYEASGSKPLPEATITTADQQAIQEQAKVQEEAKPVVKPRTPIDQNIDKKKLPVIATARALGGSKDDQFEIYKSLTNYSELSENDKKELQSEFNQYARGRYTDDKGKERGLPGFREIERARKEIIAGLSDEDLLKEITEKDKATRSRVTNFDLLSADDKNRFLAARQKFGKAKNDPRQTTDRFAEDPYSSEQQEIFDKIIGGQPEVRTTGKFAEFSQLLKERGITSVLGTDTPSLLLDAAKGPLSPEQVGNSDSRKAQFVKQVQSGLLNYDRETKKTSITPLGERLLKFATIQGESGEITAIDYDKIAGQVRRPSDPIDRLLDYDDLIKQDKTTEFEAKDLARLRDAAKSEIDIEQLLVGIAQAEEEERKLVQDEADLVKEKSNQTKKRRKKAQEARKNSKRRKSKNKKSKTTRIPYTIANITSGLGDLPIAEGDLPYEYEIQPRKGSTNTLRDRINKIKKKKTTAESASPTATYPYTFYPDYSIRPSAGASSNQPRIGTTYGPRDPSQSRKEYNFSPIRPARQLVISGPVSIPYTLPFDNGVNTTYEDQSDVLLSKREIRRRRLAARRKRIGRLGFFGKSDLRNKLVGPPIPPGPPNPPKGGGGFFSNNFPTFGRFFFGGPGGPNKPKTKGLFNRIDGGGLLAALLAGGSTGAGVLQSQSQSKIDAGTGGVTEGILADILTSSTSGGLTGSAFGPQGAIAGAVLGGLVGFLTNNSADRLAASKFDKKVLEFAEVLDQVAKGSAEPAAKLEELSRGLKLFEDRILSTTGADRETARAEFSQQVLNINELLTKVADTSTSIDQFRKVVGEDTIKTFATLSNQTVPDVIKIYKEQIDAQTKAVAEQVKIANRSNLAVQRITSIRSFEQALDKVTGRINLLSDTLTGSLNSNSFIDPRNNNAQRADRVAGLLGGNIGQRFIEEVQQAQKIENVLPQILSNVRFNPLSADEALVPRIRSDIVNATGLDSDNVVLNNLLNGIDDIIGSTGDPTVFLKKLDSEFGNVVNQLSDKLTQLNPLIAKLENEIANAGARYSNILDTLGEKQLNLVNEQAKFIQIQSQKQSFNLGFGNARPSQLFNAAQATEQRLLNNTVQGRSVAALANERFTAEQEIIRLDQEILTAKLKDAAQLNDLLKTRAKEKVILEDTTRALQFLSEASNTTAAAQQELSRIESARASKTEFASNLVFGSSDNRREQALGLRDAIRATAQGDLFGFSDEQRQRIDSVLNQLKDSRIFAGRTGSEARQRLIRGEFIRQGVNPQLSTLVSGQGKTIQENILASQINTGFNTALEAQSALITGDGTTLSTINQTVEKYFLENIAAIKSTFQQEQNKQNQQKITTLENELSKLQGINQNISSLGGNIELIRSQKNITEPLTQISKDNLKVSEAQDQIRSLLTELYNSSFKSTTEQNKDFVNIRRDIFTALSGSGISQDRASDILQDFNPDRPALSFDNSLQAFKDLFTERRETLQRDRQNILSRLDNANLSSDTRNLLLNDRKELDRILGNIGSNTNTNDNIRRINEILAELAKARNVPTFNSGGMVGGSKLNKESVFKFTPKGKDKIPAMLADGEFVMKKNAVDKYGIGMMQAINAGYFAGGGMVSAIPNSGLMEFLSPTEMALSILGRILTPDKKDKGVISDERLAEANTFINSLTDQDVKMAALERLNSVTKSELRDRKRKASQANYDKVFEKKLAIVRGENTGFGKIDQEVPTTWRSQKIPTASNSSFSPSIVANESTQSNKGRTATSTLAGSRGSGYLGNGFSIYRPDRGLPEAGTPVEDAAKKRNALFRKRADERRAAEQEKYTYLGATTPTQRLLPGQRRSEVTNRPSSNTYNTIQEKQEKSIKEFSKTSDKMTEAMNNFPREVSHTINGKVEVILNGAEVLSSIQPAMQELIDRKIAEGIKNFVDSNLPELS